MRAGDPRGNRYSSLAKRAYDSLSPVALRKSPQRTTLQPSASKYHYLAAQSNHNQQIIKEIISTERKYTSSWKASGYGATEPFNTTYGTTHSNFSYGNSPNFPSPGLNASSSNGLGNFSRTANQQSLTSNPFASTQAQFSKSHVRSRTFDPILGHDKDFPTPSGVFRALGSNHADLYRLSGLHRSPSISHFQGTLRSKT